MLPHQKDQHVTVRFHVDVEEQRIVALLGIESLILGNELGWKLLRLLVRVDPVLGWVGLGEREGVSE